MCRNKLVIKIFVLAIGLAITTNMISQNKSQKLRANSHIRIRVEDYKKIDLTPLESANAYIISNPGDYTFDASVKGNREDMIIDVTNREVAADFLWTDAPGAVVNINYDRSNTSISFSVGKDPDTGEAYRGNTVIALYDKATNEILWTWHLWLTEEPATVITGGYVAGGTAEFPADASNGHLYIMDRNLGAISADPSDGWKTYGLYYQMGRKDPIVGANMTGSKTQVLTVLKDGDKNADIKAWQQYDNDAFSNATNHTEWNTVLAPKGWVHYPDFITIDRSVKEPMTMAGGAYYSNGNKTMKKDYEKDDGTIVKIEIDDRWTHPDLNSGIYDSQGGHEDYWNRTKTIFDPCPSGWTVLGERKGRFLNKDATSQSDTNTYGVTSTYTYDGTVYSVWWPASGFRDIVGRVSNLGYGGYYCHYDHMENNHGVHGSYFEKTTIQMASENGKVKTNHASSIRCVRVSQKP